MQAARAAEEAESNAKAKPALAQEDDESDPSAYYESRKNAVEKLKEGGGNPYPHKYKVDLSLPEFISKFGATVKPGEHMEETVSVAGRVQFRRSSGAKLIFYTLMGEGKTIQVMADQRVSEHSDDVSAFTSLHNSVKRGDIIAVTGKPGASKKGELSIFPVHMEVRCSLILSSLAMHVLQTTCLIPSQRLKPDEMEPHQHWHYPVAYLW
jgi:lysyl-tRNA synthetase, class II